jgi:hypothetical protein
MLLQQAEDGFAHLSLPHVSVFGVAAKELMKRQPAETFLAHVLRRVISKVYDGDSEGGSDMFVVPLGAMQELSDGGAELANFLLPDIYLSDEFNPTEFI